MPHDRDSKLLAVGDMVDIGAKVKEIHQTENHCNVTLETETVMFPGDQRTTILLNAKQVKRRPSVEDEFFYDPRTGRVAGEQ